MLASDGNTMVEQLTPNPKFVGLNPAVVDTVFFFKVIESTTNGAVGDSTVDGALFIAVCRGKVSEGLVENVIKLLFFAF